MGVWRPPLHHPPSSTVPNFSPTPIIPHFWQRYPKWVFLWPACSAICHPPNPPLWPKYFYPPKIFRALTVFAIPPMERCDPIPHCIATNASFYFCPILFLCDASTLWTGKTCDNMVIKWIFLSCYLPGTPKRNLFQITPGPPFLPFEITLSLYYSH